MGEIQAILDKAVAGLLNVPGIKAIVLGGSRARGTHLPDSDIDIGIYYDESLDLTALEKAAQHIDDEHRQNLIAPPGAWGNWVNGGGWLTISQSSVDLILRDLARVKIAVNESLEGIVSAHYQTGHPHAFFNVMYMGEIAVCRILWEDGKQISDLKRLTKPYPDKLKESLIHLFSFEAEFSLWLAQSSLDKNDLYYVTAHIVRCVSALNQVLFALNETYFLNEKKAVMMIDTFHIQPLNYKGRIEGIFLAAADSARDACVQLRQLIEETKLLLREGKTVHVDTTLGNLSNSKM